MPSHFVEAQPLALQLFAVCFGVTLLATLFIRLINGAGPTELMRTRFYEIPPARGLIHVMHVSLWGVALTAAFITLSHGRAYWLTSQNLHLYVALIAAGVGVVHGLLAFAVLRFLVRI